MANEEKLSTVELGLVVAIGLILLFFPFHMVSEHQQDVAAMSHYHDGK
jgi:hypothetical protein